MKAPLGVGSTARSRRRHPSLRDERGGSARHAGRNPLRRMSTRIEAAARTHQGRRENNEDAHLVDLPRGLFVVADGMGGYEGGEIASGIVVQTIAEFFARNEADADLTWPWGVEPELDFVSNLVTVAVRLAHAEVRRERRRGGVPQMGSTVVVAATDGDRLVCAHVGDSRIYRLRDGELEALTRDHSLLEELRASGMAEHPAGLSHIVTRAIGFGEDTRPDVRVERILPGDTLLLASDGVTDPLDEATIAQALSRARVEHAADALVHAAYDAGGTDNITALVVRATSAP